MKIQITVLVIIGIILTSCTPEAAAQEIEVATEVPITEVPATEEPVITEVSIPTESSTELPTETPFACVTLLAPANGIDLPVTGKVSFSWTPMEKVESYVLNFILPSGQIASFETEQTFLVRYMEAFLSGGQYQWQVTAQGADGNEICVSQIATFTKPAYEKYEKPKDDHNDDGNDGEGGDDCDPISGCGGNH